MLLFGGILLAIAAGCGGPGEGSGAAGSTSSGTTENLSGELTLVGSTTIQPVAEVLAEAYESLHPDVMINVQGGGSSVGVTSAGQGTADIGMASRDIKASEFEEFPDIVVHTIARDGIAIIASPDVTVSDLSLDQIRGIFSGTIVSWRQVGGPDIPIVVISREEGSGTRGAFEEMVMGEDAVISAAAILQPSNGAVLTTVAGTPSSIAYLSFGYINDSVKTISIGGVAPTPENAASGTYPVVRPLNLVTKGEPDELARSFIDFIYSADGQAIVVQEGYLSVN
ncbi:phosphate ABC transporter substrate-binding protein [Candidatus Fermentibacteria bacterium]|nr:phosphate ABC transporter substrate-binding protein [Candidatus Fermentibacteria bacterium]